MGKSRLDPQTAGHIHSQEQKELNLHTCSLACVQLGLFHPYTSQDFCLEDGAAHRPISNIKVTELTIMVVTEEMSPSDPTCDDGSESVGGCQAWLRR